MTFGQILKAVMKHKSVTQDQLADGIDRKQATISGYVNDKIDPGFKTIESIAEFVGMTPGEFLEFKTTEGNDKEDD